MSLLTDGASLPVDIGKEEFPLGGDLHCKDSLAIAQKKGTEY
jgi:hypothetical protein